MAELSVPRLDFSTLGELPATYRDARKATLEQRYEAEAPKLLADLYAPQASGQQPSLTTLGRPTQIPPSAMPGIVPQQRSAGEAISSVESGGRYEALGPVTKTGDRAYGKYQVMGENIGPWSKEALGRELTPQEFVSSPEAQDAVFKAKFGQYEQKYGPEGAAKAWFAGEQGMNNQNAKDQLGTTVSAYADKFNKALGPQVQQTAQAAPQQASDGFTVIPTPSTPGMPPQLREKLPQLLQNPKTRASAIALAQKYQNPEQWQLVKDQSGNVFSRNVQNGEMKMLDKSTLMAPDEFEQKKELARAGTNVEAQVEDRRRAAAAVGFDKSKPGYESFILTGKMPREDQQPLTATDKKAIIEADEGVLAGETAIEGLKQAKVLSPKALAGPMAGSVGYVGSLFGNEAGGATVDLQNLITSNALTQLKSIFGGMPTEGERKILLDVQGSVNLPDEQRQKIYDRAIVAANKRLEFNKQRASSLRGGTFYKSQGGQEQSGSEGGSPKAGSVVRGYRFKGGDPAVESNWEKAN